MIAVKVLATFCLATFCLASPATLTENELKLELAKLELLKDTAGKLSETIPERALVTENEEQIQLLKDTIRKLSETIPDIDAKLVKEGWTPQGEEELIEEPIAAEGKRKS